MNPLDLFDDPQGNPEFFSGGRKIVSLYPLQRGGTRELGEPRAYESAPLSVPLTPEWSVSFYLNWDFIGGGSAPCNGTEIPIQQEYTVGLTQELTAEIQSKLESELGVKGLARIAGSISSKMGVSITLTTQHKLTRRYTIAPPPSGTKFLELYQPVVQYNFSSTSGKGFYLREALDFIYEHVSETPTPVCRRRRKGKSKKTKDAKRKKSAAKEKMRKKTSWAEERRGRRLG